MIDIPDALARLVRPEYVGENRCLPCTAANVGIAGALAAALGVAVSARAGVIAFAASLILIGLRGYLIPGTPTLTRRYFPEPVLASFGKSSPVRPTVETVTPEELTAVLTAADVAVVRDGEIRPAASVRGRWDDRFPVDGASDPSPDEVASILGADDLEQLDDTAFVVDGRKRVRWESTAALAADVASVPVLRSRLEGWEPLGVDERRDLLTGVRLLLDRCPACGAAVTTDAERLEHCCRRPRIGIRSVCEGCDRPAVELVVAESAADPWLELAGVALAEDSATEP